MEAVPVVAVEVVGKYRPMSKERQSLIERAAEFSKKVDYVVIAAGGMVFLLNPAVGIAIILGSVLTMIPAEMIKKSAKRRRLSKA